jgi:predicted nucleic acid-binding protein
MGEASSSRAARLFADSRVAMIHLDTSFLIRALVHGSPEDRALRQWLSAGRPLGISAIAWAEFLYGPVKAAHAELARGFISERVPFLEEDAPVSSQLFNDGGRRRGSFIDCMIAATALRAGAMLATANADDFRRFEAAGLEVYSA